MCRPSIVVEYEPLPDAWGRPIVHFRRVRRARVVQGSKGLFSGRLAGWLACWFTLVCRTMR